MQHDPAFGGFFVIMGSSVSKEGSSGRIIKILSSSAWTNLLILECFLLFK